MVQGRLAYGLHTGPFCVTAHLRVYAPLQKLHPNFFIKALTDDLLPHVAKPQNADYPAAYVQVIQFRKDYDRLGNPHGLFRHPGKSKLLIPPEAPDPDPSLGLAFCRDGVVVAGAPIGTDDYISTFTATKVISCNEKVDRITTLAYEFPQMTLRILKTSAAHLLDYLSKLTSPMLFVPIAQIFDQKLADAVMKTLTTEHANIQMQHRTAC